MDATVITHEEAIEVGLDRYWPGTPCAHGHVGEHYVANCACVECNDQLTPAQHAFLFKHPVDAEYAQKRLTVKTWAEWEAFFVRWDAARREEAERIRFETVQRGQKRRHGPPRRYLRERRSPRSISRDVRKGLARTRPK